jgi:hypothetical protein
LSNITPRADQRPARVRVRAICNDSFKRYDGETEGGGTVEVQPLPIIADELRARPVVTASIINEAVDELKLAKGSCRVRRHQGDRWQARLTRFRK